MYPMKVIDVQYSRILEQKTHEGGHSYAEMMEDAGRNLARAIQTRLPSPDLRVLILVGPGNNGGDGLVAAHYLHSLGVQPEIYLWKRSGDDDPNLQRAQDDGIPLFWAEQDADRSTLRRLCQRADAMVDALLGVGIHLPIKGELRDILDVVRSELCARCSSPDIVMSTPSPREHPLVFAVDCPTGLDCDTGELDSAALKADLTITFGYPKTGLLRFPGAEAVGQIVVADIGIPPNLVDRDLPEMVTPDTVAAVLPARPRGAHKGTFGKALIVAGSVNYIGAAALAGMGATRTGTGLVTLALPRPIQQAVAAQLPEATYLLLPHDLGVINANALPVLGSKLGDYDALLLGPGLGREPETAAFVQALVAPTPSSSRGRIGFLDRQENAAASPPQLPPLVVDADGLNLLAALPEWWQSLPPNTILTPHPGEMARLLGGEATVGSVQQDREGIASRMSQEWQCVVVLKGAHTVVAAPDGRVAISPFANPGLATAGTGDVLAGAIVGLRAQGLQPYEAAVAGVYLHALAGDLAARDIGSAGTVASDLPPMLPRALDLTRSQRRPSSAS